jgi:tetratricopeptide (TPR) repeat protein
MSDVIHVVFGPGGGRIDATPSPEQCSPGPIAPVAAAFSRTEAARLLGLSPARLRQLERVGIADPSCWRHGNGRPQRAYTFTEVAELRSIAALLRRNVSVRTLAIAVWGARKRLPDVPLSALRFEQRGKRVVIHSREGSLDPSTGQALLELEPARDNGVLALQPCAERDSRLAFELYQRAATLDENPATYDDAERLYRRAIALDPELSVAYTNLANVLFRRHDIEGAKKLYREALRIDPRQSEAQYNLGYIALERGDAHQAIPLLLGALAAEPTFADACFNLAMAYEQTGQAGKAQVHWRRYLQLEPHGAWADRARRHLR